MKCCNPKRMVCVHEDGSPFVILVPCQHCYGCEQTNKAEWCVRLSYECKGKYVAFLTLTYSDEKVPLLKGVSRESVFAESRKLENKRNYGDLCAIYRPDCTEFLKNLREDWRAFRGDKSLCRFVINFEYGDDTNRPHAHCILIFPEDTTFEQYSNYMLHLGAHPYNDRRTNEFPPRHKCVLWHFGNVVTQYLYDSNDTAQISSYASKHCTKSCSGSRRQQIEAPIFRRTSTFKGGIGTRQMAADPKVIAAFENKSYITSVGEHGKVYKVGVPRSVQRILHPQNLTENELYEVSFKTLNTEMKLIKDWCSLNGKNPQFWYLYKDDYYSVAYASDCKARKDMERRRKLKHDEKKRKRNN